MNRLSYGLPLVASALILPSCADGPLPPSSPAALPTTVPTASTSAGVQVDGLRAVVTAANNRLSAMGVGVRIGQAEWITRPESHRIGQSVFFTSHGNKQLPFDFVPGDPRRSGRSNILYLVDQSDGAAVGGLSSTQTEAAIDRAAASWNAVGCATIPIEKAADTGVDPDVVDFFAGVGDLGAINLGPVVTVDIVHGGFLGAEFFDGLTPGCIAGSNEKPCGSVFILGITFTDGFVDAAGNFTDLNRDGKIDVAFREIYYNNADPDANGVTIPWRINAFPDVESVALHELGHGLSQSHFGMAFVTDGNDKIHFSPLAVMNAGGVEVRQELLGTDVAGHCGIWGDWPNQ